MSPDKLIFALQQKKLAAEQEKLGHLERLGIAEGFALACQWTLDELAKPEPEPSP